MESNYSLPVIARQYVTLWRRTLSALRAIDGRRAA
jgi:hypothetical protein